MRMMYCRHCERALDGDLVVEHHHQLCGRCATKIDGRRGDEPRLTEHALRARKAIWRFLSKRSRT